MKPIPAHQLAIAAVTLPLGAFLAMVFFAPFPSDSDDFAAWVQGIGSVAAIAAAIWIDRGSARRLNASEAARRSRLTTGFYSAAWEATQWITATGVAASDARYAEMARNIAERKGFRVHLTHAEELLRSFSASDLADIGLMAHAIRLRQMIAIAISALDDDSYEALRRASRMLTATAETAHTTFTIIADDTGLPRIDVDAEVSKVLHTSGGGDI